MQHKVKVTVLDKKLYPELQEKYCKDPHTGVCPCYNVGDEYIFERYQNEDHYWRVGLNTLRKCNGNEKITAGSKYLPHCSEAWDAISRYIYSAIEGGAIMRSWMNKENTMITCCNDGTRPVIFKIERIDYKVIYLENSDNLDKLKADIKEKLLKIDGIYEIEFKKDWIEAFINKYVDDEIIKDALKEYNVIKID